MKKVYVDASHAMKKSVARSLRRRHSVPGWALLLIAILVPLFAAKFPDRSAGVAQVASVQVAGAVPAASVPEEPVSGCVLSSALPRTVAEWKPEICLAAHEFSLDPNLISAVIWWESKGSLMAVSRAGARGLMQVMPHHFGLDTKPNEDYTQEELERMHAPLSNIRHGCMYLRKCLDASRANGTGRWTALAAYNGGITNVIYKTNYFKESIRLANGVSDLYQRTQGQ